MGVAFLVGVAVAVPTALVISVPLGLLIGWDTTAVVYLIWLWTAIGPRDAAQTAARATTADPDRRITDVLLLTASVASLVAVGFVLARAGQNQGVEELLRIALAVASLALSWAVVHTVFALRYALLYYSGAEGGIDFNEPDPPTFGDFAYLAFTIGMTFQVSDTPLRSKDIRRTALRHGLLSYLFGTGILASAVNLVAGLSSR
ncbi:DUF1345 domain-containing protein [Pseudonocardia sp. T1-2H]|uniref:DUF1345 domain-containing protein n=1 Tax=Pseudonocardia sp. T1-2H TaxID=3128899 RepID=UPI003101A2DD